MISFPEWKIHLRFPGWYEPSESRTLGKSCGVAKCGLAAAFDLCPKHAFPGMMFRGRGKTFVVGFWLLERNGDHYMMLLDDYSLGVRFGNRDNFEQQLTSQGYSVLQ